MNGIMLTGSELQNIYITIILEILFSGFQCAELTKREIIEDLITDTHCKP